MKIEINESQPLEDVVRELDRIGYKSDYTTEIQQTVVITWGSLGTYDIQSLPGEILTNHTNTTTLAELKEM